MTLILSNDDVQRALSMADSIASLEEAYKDLGTGTAISPGRRDDFLASTHPGAYYSFKSIDGGMERLKVYAQRSNPDIVSYPVIDGVVRRVKIPAAPGNRYMGLVYLYDTETLELLAIMNDAHLQRMGVAGTTGVAAKYLARGDTETLALLGSGWQAETAAWALSAVRKLRAIRIYSPNPENRELLARKLRETLPCEVCAVNEPRQAAEQAHIVATATNSQGPVMRGEWIQEGVHLTCITPMEFDETAWRKSHRIVVSSFHQNYQNNRTPHESLVGIRSDLDKRKIEAGYGEQFGTKISTLPDLVLGRASARQAANEITLFHKGVGLAIEYASLGKVVYDRAKELGLGNEVPSEWFTQSSHP